MITTECAPGCETYDFPAGGHATIHCDECGIGPFCRIEGRQNVRLCIECGNEADRQHGWSPENSAD